MSTKLEELRKIQGLLADLSKLARQVERAERSKTRRTALGGAIGPVSQSEIEFSKKATRLAAVEAEIEKLNEARIKANKIQNDLPHQDRTRLERLQHEYIVLRSSAPTPRPLAKQDAGGSSDWAATARAVIADLKQQLAHITEQIDAHNEAKRAAANFGFSYYSRQNELDSLLSQYSKIKHDLEYWQSYAATGNGVPDRQQQVVGAPIDQDGNARG